MNPQREFLHIPSGEAVTITLKYNTGLLRNGQFGKYFIYTVILDGKEKLLKVTERLEKQFRKADVQGGQEIQLRKDSVSPNQGEPYSVTNLVHIEVPRPPQPIELAFAVTPKPEPAQDRTEQSEMQLLQESLVDAQTICQSNNETATTVILAVGLFLSRTIRRLLEQSVQSSRQTFARRSKPVNAKDKLPVKNLVKKADDLPF